MSRNKIIVLALVVACIAVAAYLYSKYRIAPQISFNSLQLEDLNGNPVDLQSLKDKKVLLNFFATWCGPCVHELPELEQAADALRGNDFVFLCISDEPLDRLRNFTEQMGLHVQILHSVKPFSQLKIFTFPTSYALNLKREIVFKRVGDVNWTDEQVLQSLRNISP